MEWFSGTDYCNSGRSNGFPCSQVPQLVVADQFSSSSFPEGSLKVLLKFPSFLSTPTKMTKLDEG